MTDRPPFLPFLEAHLSRLPGVVPIVEEDWIVSPPDLNEQLAYRDRLLREQPSDVVGLQSDGLEASLELLDVLLVDLSDRAAWDVREQEVLRPDGQTIAIDRANPLIAIGRLVSEDFCILTRVDGAAEYVLVAGAVCFPAGWSLPDKLGQPLTLIHDPVPDYDGNLAKRVNRIFDGIRAEQLLLRFNWGLPAHAELHATPENYARLGPSDGQYLRVERQTFRRLRRTQAVVFGIRTTVTPVSALLPREAKALLLHVEQLSDEMLEYKSGLGRYEQLRSTLSALANA